MYALLHLLQQPDEPGQLCCALNPEICNEAETKFEKPAAEPKKVHIAGGGIAGMQAALTAVKRGHRVILCEKSGRLGGVLRCEKDVPFKKHLHDYLNHQELMISRSAIDLRLNTEVTPELARRLELDVIIAALGSEPYIPSIKGIDGSNVAGAEEIYINPEKAGRRLVILEAALWAANWAYIWRKEGMRLLFSKCCPILNNGGNILQGQSIGSSNRETRH
jgi:NADPH-dependent 2,4-dienoyl-CoA reductase/sulfur reductase-like enzyme